MSTTTEPPAFTTEDFITAQERWVAVCKEHLSTLDDTDRIMGAWFSLLATEIARTREAEQRIAALEAEVRALREACRMETSDPTTGERYEHCALCGIEDGDHAAACILAAARAVASSEGGRGDG
jgi:hypothetical protein